VRDIAPPKITARMKLMSHGLPTEGKIVVDACAGCPLSNAKRNLYARPSRTFKKRGDPNTDPVF